MTEFDKVFIDTAPYIYLLERNDTFFEKTEDFFVYCIDSQKKLVTSTVTVEEFSVGPYKNDDKKLIDDFHSFLLDTFTTVLNIDESIADEAAKIRANHSGFKGMDALQLASAKVAGCDLFLTNDKRLKQFTDLKVMTIEEMLQSFRQ